MVHDASSEDLKTKAKRALKAILAKCTHLAALQPLLRDAPMKVLRIIFLDLLCLFSHALIKRVYVFYVRI
jgi:hypothetical protein